MASSYEVTDGIKVYGTFSSQSKADALKKELKAEGVKARVRITYDEKPARTKKAAEPKIPKVVKKSTPKPVKPKPIKPKEAPAKPREEPKAPRAPVKPKAVPRRPKIDFRTCSIDQLAEVLFEVQEPDVQFMEKAEIRAALSDPFKTVGLCDTFLEHSLWVERYYDRWEDLNLTENDITAIRDRLIDLKAQAQAYIDSTVPDEPPAPVEKPKKGLFKRKSKSKTGLAARDDFLKRIEGPLKKLGMDIVPVTEAHFALVDPAHICMIEFVSRTGNSLFGIPDDSPRIRIGDPLKGIEISKVRQNIGSYFDADGNPIPARLKADADQDFYNARVPQLSLIGSYAVDPATFKKELVRANKIGASDQILLYARNGDLMLSIGENAPSKPCTLNGMRADVGDGDDVEAVSAFPLDYSLKLADLMVQADGPCTVDIDNDYPVIIQCVIGDFDVTMMLAPRIGD